MATKHQPDEPSKQNPRANQKPTRKDPAAESAAVDSPVSLDHGVPSLVAQDNPDDSQLGAPRQSTGLDPL